MNSPEEREQQENQDLNVTENVEVQDSDAAEETPNTEPAPEKSAPTKKKLASGRAAAALQWTIAVRTRYLGPTAYSERTY